MKRAANNFPDWSTKSKKSRVPCNMFPVSASRIASHSDSCHSCARPFSTKSLYLRLSFFTLAVVVQCSSICCFAIYHADAKITRNLSKNPLPRIYINTRGRMPSIPKAAFSRRTNTVVKCKSRYVLWFLGFHNDRFYHSTKFENKKC